MFLFDETGEFNIAAEECQKYGFSDIQDLRGSKLRTDVLSTDTYRGFTGLYEEALDQGSSLVFYPNE